MPRLELDIELLLLTLSKTVFAIELLSVEISMKHWFPLLELTIWRYNSKIYGFRFSFLFFFGVMWRYHRLTYKLGGSFSDKQLTKEESYYA